MAKCSTETKLKINLNKLHTLTKAVRMEHLFEKQVGTSWHSVETEDGFIAMKTLHIHKDIAHALVNFAAAGSTFESHIHDGIEVFLVFQGVMELKTSGETIILGDNQKTRHYYLNAKQPHGAYFPENTYFYAVTMPPEPSWPKD